MFAKVFTGKDYDEDASLYYFNARWYDPETGRFTSLDPIRDGLNWYVYCSNNPVNFVDPTGLIDYVDRPGTTCPYPIDPPPSPPPSPSPAPAPTPTPSPTPPPSEIVNPIQDIDDPYTPNISPEVLGEKEIKDFTALENKTPRQWAEEHNSELWKFFIDYVYQNDPENGIIPADSKFQTWKKEVFGTDYSKLHEILGWIRSVPIKTLSISAGIFDASLYLEEGKIEQGLFTALETLATLVGGLITEGVGKVIDEFKFGENDLVLGLSIKGALKQFKQFGGKGNGGFASTSDNFAGQIYDAMTQAEKIRFNLTGVDVKRVSGLLNELGEPIEGYTNYELWLILTTPSFLKKTIFYVNNKAIPSPF